MSKLKEASSNIKALARTFQSVIDLSNALDEVGSIEQAEAEARRRTVATQKEIEKVNKELSVANLALETANASAKKAKADAAAQVKKAEETAASIKQKAVAEAEKIVGDAGKEAKAVQTETTEKRKVVKDLDAQIAERQQALNALNDEIAAVKARASAIAS